MTRIKTSLLIILLSVTSGLAQAQTSQVFHPEIRSANPSPVYDFVERYFAELEACKDVELLRLKMKDDKVEVLEGSLAAIRTITPETPFALNRMGDSFYQLTWQNGSKPLLTLRFPVNYELLLGMPKVEIEKKMKSLISDTEQQAPVAEAEEQEYELQDDGCYKTKPSMFYQLKSFNDSRYYTKDVEGYVPVFNDSHNWYSAANLFQGVINPGERKLYVEQNMYGGEKASYTVELAQWLAYCKANSLKVYFTIEEEREDGLKALLIAHSDEMNYNHMLQLIIPDNFIEKDNCVIKAVMNAFIPTQNVKDLYQKYTVKPKKRI